MSKEKIISEIQKIAKNHIDVDMFDKSRLRFFIAETCSDISFRGENFAVKYTKEKYDSISDFSFINVIDGTIRKNNIDTNYLNTEAFYMFNSIDDMFNKKFIDFKDALFSMGMKFVFDKLKENHLSFSVHCNTDNIIVSDELKFLPKDCNFGLSDYLLTDKILKPYKKLMSLMFLKNQGIDLKFCVGGGGRDDYYKNICFLKISQGKQELIIGLTSEQILNKKVIF